jgi:hypothetical protein
VEAIIFLDLDGQRHERQRHKQCASTPTRWLCSTLLALPQGLWDWKQGRRATPVGTLQRPCRFWSPERKIFVNNLPWIKEEGGARLCDRSLATAVLFDQCPGQNTDQAMLALVECPPEMGFSYPANAGWRLWALAKGGQADVILQDLRERWATMDSVKLNNTLQEDWQTKPDSGQQWSHCAVGPLYIAAGDWPGHTWEPGQRVEVRPQPADLSQLELVARTVRGPLVFRLLGNRGNREFSLELPKGCEGEIVLPEEEAVDLTPLPKTDGTGLRRYGLPAGGAATLRLKQL